MKTFLRRLILKPSHWQLQEPLHLQIKVSWSGRMENYVQKIYTSSQILTLILLLPLQQEVHQLLVEEQLKKN